VGKNKVIAKPSNPSTAELDLETVIRWLHVSDIRVGIQTYDDGMQVWISDRLHRVREERLFDQSSANFMWMQDSAALWLHAAALRLFPDNLYARRFRTGKIKDNGNAETRPDYRLEVMSKP
jgi:hypothetical protein